MPMQKSLRKYVTNIISFANSRIRNKLRDRSHEFYAGEVTPELEQLMRDVWQPIVGSGQDIIVLHIRKPRGATSLGFSIQGVDEVLDLDASRKPLVSGLQNGRPVGFKYPEPRHFVQTVQPEGLVGPLNIIHPGDELLQVNGRRLRGTSRTHTVRCLRNLPTHIELVLARPRADVPIWETVLDTMPITDDPPLELLASEVNSVDTTYLSQSPAEIQMNNSAISNSHPAMITPTTARYRVSEWVRRSVADQPDGYSRPNHLNRPQSFRLQPNSTVPFNAAPYPIDANMPGQVLGKGVTNMPVGGTLDRFRGRQSVLANQSGHAYGAFTLPRHTIRQTKDPRYGEKRPVWSSIPLLIQLNKTAAGFGFSLSEYEELLVSDTDFTTNRRSFTLGRREASHRPLSSPEKLRRSSTLPSSKRKSSSRKRAYLLVDSVIPGSAAHQDGRISVGDRLLFINDRNLSRATLREAASALRAVPNGPCLLGIAKMHLEPNFIPKSAIHSHLPDSAFPPESTPYSGYEALCTPRESSWLSQSVSPYLVDQGDHPLDFHVLPELDFQSNLHAHELNVPQLDEKFEKTVHIKLCSMPIGLKLDALAAGGQDGCRVLQVLRGGSIHHTGVLHPNDYITALNGTTMRNITNLEAFHLLKSMDMGEDLEISFFPGDVVRFHRLSHLGPEQCASLLNGPSVNTDGSHRELKAWHGTIEQIVLTRHPSESAWGLELSGTSLVVPPPTPPYPILDNPTFVASITPNSPAERSGLLQPGDVLLKINDQDVSNLGPVKTSELLRQQAASEALQLCLGVRYCTSTPPYPMTPGISEKQLVVVDVEHGPKSELRNQQPALSQSIGFDRAQVDKPTEDSSLSSSQIEAPEPLSELDSRDELNVLSRPIRASVTRMNGGPIVDSSEEPTNLASITCPVLEDDVSPSANADYKHGSPPPPPPRLFSSGSPPFSFDQELLHLPDVEGDPVTLYTRSDPPGDHILTVPISLPRTSPPSSDPSSQSSRVESLGIRLVMGHPPESRSTYVAGLTPGSLAATQNILQVGDEIVQVGRKDVQHLGPLAVRQFIHNILLDQSNSDRCSPTETRTLSLVVRRNPSNFQRMSGSPERILLRPNWEAQEQSSKPSDVKSSTSVDEGPVSLFMLENISNLLNEPLDLYEIFNLSLKRNENGYGIFIVNYGPNDTPGIFVSELPPDGAAAKQGVLRPFDRILAVNGEIQRDYDTTLQLMKQSVDQVYLTVARRKTPIHSTIAAQPVATSSPAPTLPMAQPTELVPSVTKNPIIPGQATLIELVREAGSNLGFSIVGGKDTLLGDILIHSIRDDGVAAADGRLQVGDRLWAINGVDLRGADHIIAKHLIQSARDTIRLLVYRDPPPYPTNLADSGLVRCVLYRAPGQNLGLSLISRSPYGPGTAISAVMEDTPAEHCGQFQPSDVLVEVNGVDVRLAQTQEVVSMLKSATGSVSLVVERQPDSKRPPHPPREPVHRLQLYLVALCRPGSGGESHKVSQASIGFSEPLLGFSNADGSFGLFLREATDEEIAEAGGQLIVDDIAPGSPAALSIMIKPGDRLLSVDREPVDWLQPDEVFQLLANMSQCTLELGRIPIPPYPVDPGLSMAYYPSDQPPYPTISAELPPVLSGVMPTVQTDTRFIDAVDEEQEDHGFPLPNHTDPRVNEDHSDSLSSSVSSVLVREAVAKAKFATGFQVKQFYLPPASPGKSLGLRLTKGPDIGGAIVVSLDTASAAAEAGLRVGDQILGLDNQLLLAQESDTSRKLLRRIDEAWRLRGNAQNNPLSLTVITASPPIELKDTAASCTAPPTVDDLNALTDDQISDHAQLISRNPPGLRVETDCTPATEHNLNLADSSPSHSDAIDENEPLSVVTSSDQPMTHPASESHSTEPVSHEGTSENCESPDSGVDAEILNSLHASVKSSAEPAHDLPDS